MEFRRDADVSISLIPGLVRALPYLLISDLGSAAAITPNQ